ncbi:Exportin-7-B [Porphyridium purpureum]|uniref:Exportin-7-B n=1 Tax=Porphyridium purpureum TaxID=35688 RepID=A0A5J4Z8L7_PORPP|nr:Exportin-7-B [Porphyridium purpureum]|eukprot:POR6398..scf295_1
MNGPQLAAGGGRAGAGEMAPGAGGASKDAWNGLGDLPDLAQIDALARQLYESADPQLRAQAEAVLMPLGASPENTMQCVMLLQESQASTTLMLASSSLTKIVTAYGTRISGDERVQLYQFVIQFLAERGPALPNFVVSELCTLLSRLVKMSWSDDARFRAVLEDMKPFLDASQEHCVLALQVLNRLVLEMNHSSPMVRRSFTQAQHRRVATAFRDSCLQQVYTQSLTILVKCGSAPPNVQPHRLRQVALDLAATCMNFDFIGTSFDESTEDFGAVQVPISWRAIIEDASTPRLFFDTYVATYQIDPRQSSAALECLVQLASVRRSLFSSDEKRLEYLETHMRFMIEILGNRVGLDEHDNYHRFCRWLARLKANYQLAELVGSSLYSDWIGLVSQFSLHSLASDWHWVGNSLFYLLSLWSRMVASMPYLKGNNLSRLDDHVQKIVEAYVTSRLQALHNGDADDESNDAEFAEHLDTIPVLFRLQYDKTCQFLVSMLDPLLEQYKALVVERGMTSASSSEVAMVERDLAWLVKVTGAAVGGRLSASSSEDQEVADGLLSSRVFQLMIYSLDVDQKLKSQQQNESSLSGRSPGSVLVVSAPQHLQAPPTQPTVRLDEAIVDFTQNFRKAYIGEQAVQHSKVYATMAEKLGIRDHMFVLNVVASKIACNLRHFGVSGTGDEVISKSLTLLSDLAGGHSSGRLLGKLATIREMLAEHDEKEFPFMTGADARMGRQRTNFHQILARIMFAGFGVGDIYYDADSAFELFMRPIALKLDAISQVRNEQILQDAAVKAAVIGVARDLRGVCLATQLRKTYNLLFDWYYPTYAQAMYRALDVGAAAGAHELVTPILKFYADLAHNRPQRITFDSSSPNGILLFRETSKVLVAYGSHALSQLQGGAGALQASTGGTGTAGGGPGAPYRSLYKPASVCFTIFSRALSGNYVNFGVFSLYGDSAFQDALEVCLRLALAIPVSDLMAYQKVTRSFFGMMEILCLNHTSSVVDLEHAVFGHIVRVLQEGLSSSEVWMSTQCASALDHLAEFRFVGVKKNLPGGQRFLQHVAQSPDLFPRILQMLMTMILNEDCANQWSLSRPLLSVILTNQDAFLELKSQMIQALQNPQWQATAQEAFEKLMENVQLNLESKNRDRFTQNVTVFRHTWRSIQTH